MDGEQVEAGPLDDIQFVDGAYVFGGVDDTGVAGDDAGKERFHRMLDNLIGPEKLGRFIAWVYGRAGRKYELQSLQIDKDNPDFKDACTYLYEDLKGGVLGPVIDTLPLEALERILVYFLGFGAPVYCAYQEAKSRPVIEQTGDNEDMEAAQNEQS